MIPEIHLLPGRIFAHRRRHRVTTLLGSCVAVAIWDARMGHGGITHSILPTRRGRGAPAERYTDDAIDALLRRLGGFGSRSEHLCAKIFGGGNVFETLGAGATIGGSNLDVATERLAAHGIVVGARRIGGDEGMVIQMDTGTGEVLVRPVPRSQE